MLTVLCCSVMVVVAICAAIKMESSWLSPRAMAQGQLPDEQLVVQPPAQREAARELPVADGAARAAA